MRNLSLTVLFFVLFLFGCRQKEKELPKKYISVKSLIEKQVEHIDSSFYSIIKVVNKDSTHYDTSYIKRENFREAAKDFLDIPDLSDPKTAKRFTEEASFDTLIRKVIITYTPVKPESEELQKAQLLVSQEIDKEGSNKVSTIIIEKARKDKQSSFQQNLLWRMDKSFLITTSTQKPGEPEEVTVTRVTWNEDKY